MKRIILFSVLFSISFSATLLVPTEYSTIQSGIDASADGDTVLVSAGTYNESLLLSGKNIVLESVEGPEITIIDAGQQNDRALLIENGINNSTVISGFRIDNGTVPNGSTYGGGIFCNYTSPIIKNCFFNHNYAEQGGAVAFYVSEGAQIINSSFLGNDAGDNGGAIGIYFSSNVLIDSCIVTGNESVNYGGAFDVHSSGGNNIPNKISNSTITNNYAEDVGGGLQIRTGSDVIIENCIIQNNTTDGLGGGIILDGSSLEIDNSRVSNNSAANDGGGVYIYSTADGNLTMTGTELSYNIAGRAGAIYIGTNNVFIKSTLINGNIADETGGIYVSNNSSIVPTIENTTLYNNTSLVTSNSAISAVRGTFKNLIIWGNSSIGADGEINHPNEGYIDLSYSLVPFDYETNFSGDPQFTDPDNDDYTLQTTSPCIDAGDPSSPQDPDGTIADMGAYYFDQSVGCTNPYSQNYDETANVDDGSCLSATLNVPENFATIQEAIDYSIDGDTILVSAGTYYENINFNGKNIALIGEDRETTIIDGGQNGSVVTFENGESAGAILDELTIKNGSATTYNYIISDDEFYQFSAGGGIFLTDNSSPIIKNCKISENNGAIFSINGGNAQIINTIIINNLRNSGFQHTVACTSGVGLEFINCTITNNQTSEYEAVWNSPMLILKNSIYRENIDLQGSGISATYSNLSFSFSGEGNIDLNPQFTDPDNEDYTLQSTSQCIDAGDPNSPLDPDGTIADMGAFYYYQDFYGCTNPNACNYSSIATEDDGSCVYFDCNGECGGDAIVDGCGVCAGDNSSCSACIDSEACNYDSEALFDDGSCVYGDACYGCTNPDAMNYEADAVYDDGSCIVPDIIVPDDYGSIEEAFNNIALDGDVIYVRAGTYTSFEWSSDADIKLIGEDRETTIIDASGYGYGIYISGSNAYHRIDHHTLIQGFTIRNAEEYGIHAQEAQPTLRDLIIEDGVSNSYGAGIRMVTNQGADGSIDSVFVDNVIVKNNSSTTRAAGFYLYVDNWSSQSYTSVRNSSFLNNSGMEDGAGLYTVGGGDVQIKNCNFIGNTSTHGRGIALNQQGDVNSVIITDCLFADNFSEYGTTGSIISASTAYLINSIVYNNLSANHTDVDIAYNSIIENMIYQGGVYINSLDIDPLFVDAQNGNFSLLTASPCIDSGTDYLEFAGEIIYELSPDEYEGFAPDIGPWETSQMFVPDPVITNIEDIGDDQGGRVYLDIQRSFHDKEGMSRIESYQIDRLDDDSWVGVATQNAYNDSTYRVEVTTLIDSSSTSDGRTDFRVIANMEEGNFLSGTAEGYSVDNIHPEIPDNVTASIIDNDLTIEWAPSPDVDFSYSRITDLYHPQVYTVENTFNASFVESYNEYFVNSVDTHDNISENSETVSAFNLNEGANLISLNILPNDASPEYVFGNASYGAISEGVATVNQDGSWVGSLTEFNACDGYWVFMDDEINHTVIGSSFDCEYALHEGSNLKSFPCNGEVQTSSAINNECISGLMGEGVAGINIEGNWFGSLQSLQPGDAYWITSDCEIPSFEFNCSEPELTRLINKSHPKFPEGMSYSQSSSQGFYFIENIELSDRGIEEGDWILAYHNDQLIGARMWKGVYTDIPIMGKDVQANTVNYLSGGDIPALNVLTKDGELYDVNGELEPWSEGCMHVVSSLSTESALPTAYRLASVYPNPFNPQTNIVFDMPESKHVNLTIYDLLGRQVEQLINRDIDAGTHKITWDAEQYPSGIYIVQFNANNINQSQKIVLVK